MIWLEVVGESYLQTKLVFYINRLGIFKSFIINRGKRGKSGYRYIEEVLSIYLRDKSEACGE